MIKQFLRSRVALVAVVLTLFMGVISILIGKQFLLKQEDTIARVTEQQQQHIERNVAAHTDELGLLLYYVRFALISPPDKLSALSIGQRDVTPGIQSVTIRALEGQKYDTELANPTQQQSGNLDLGFVIIYLFPLVIIAFTFNLLSEETETGTWRLVAVQSRSTFRYLLSKLSVRALFLYGTLFVLLALAVVIIGVPLNGAFAGFVALGVLYLAFWFALCFWVVSFKRGSGFNVLTLLSIWTVLNILLPASVNSYVTAAHPIPESLATTVQQRNSYHEKWDMDKKVTMDKFYAHYPQFARYGVPDQEFKWLWYYAMQQMGDDESATQSQAMRAKIIQREQTSRAIALAVPTLHAQLQFNDLAQTSLGNYVGLLDSATTFHERLRLYFYPKIFDNVSAKGEDWSRFKPEYIRAEPQISWVTMLAPLVVMVLVLAVWALRNARRLTSL